MNISDLIFKHLLDDLNSEEEQALNKWLENPYNKLQFDKICNSEHIESKFDQHDQIDVEADWKQVAGKTTRKEIRLNFLKYAAAILLPVGIFLAVYLTTDVQQYMTVAEVESVVEIPNRQPVLITSDGKEHELFDRDTTLKIDNANITLGTGEVSYDKERKEAADSVKYNTLRTPKGVKYRLVLQDGTAVVLNAETTLRYPVRFGGEQRKVYLAGGEAYFEVTHDKEHPFVVDVDGVDVKVLGTSFNVKAYEDANTIQTVLVEGSVEMSGKESEINAGVVLRPGARGVFSRDEKIIVVDEVDTDVHTAWLNDQFVFYNQRLEDIMKDLSRWYDIEIDYENEGFKDLTFTADLKRYEDVNVILKALEAVDNVKFINIKNKVYVKRKNRKHQ